MLSFGEIVIAGIVVEQSHSERGIGEECEWNKVIRDVEQSHPERGIGEEWNKVIRDVEQSHSGRGIGEEWNRFHAERV